jgi:ABC-type multidrug transport system fused ATPase/permease subunit
MEGLIAHVSVGAFSIAVMGISAALVRSGSMGFALYPAAVTLSAMLFSPVLELASAAQNLGLVFAATNRIQRVLHTAASFADAGTREAPQSHEVEFENVGFAYGETPVLNNVSFVAEQGKVTALAGHSGAGKTTCTNLLLRYWDVLSGSVKIGGVDIRDLPLSTLRGLVTAVPQETYLFHISVRDNIRLGKPGASDGEVAAAAKAAQAHGFILDLPDGYDTVTGERGFQLSGGQRQRIAIARALLKDSPIIIFDEAVSSLDAETERYIQASLKETFRGKTVLLVAHRPSTLASADKVVRLAGGKVLNL